MSESEIVTVDTLVVGAGPSGATAALALATYGVSTLCISKYSSFSSRPRAHIFNQRTMEVLRHFGEEAKAMAVATPHALMGDQIFCTALTGFELGRVPSWHTHPRDQAQHDLISPCSMVDLPQNLLEPILINAAQDRGARLRFDTELLDFSQDADGVSATLLDRLSGQQFTVRARYLIGADGASSRVAEILDLPFEGTTNLAGNLGILFEADLERFIAHRPGVLYWVIQPGTGVGGYPIAGLRLVKAFNHWIATWGRPVEAPATMSEADAVATVRRIIGDDSVPVRIEGTYGWAMNRVRANAYGRGRVWCAGDAVHRHPPMNGLGSNTSAQDSFNLAWKIAYAVNGWAGPALLETYEAERLPVGHNVVRRATDNFRTFTPVAEALGFDRGEQTPEQFATMAASLADPSPAGQARRTALREAVAGTARGCSALGGEHNQFYQSSAIIADERQLSVADPEMEVIMGAEAGRRLPHVWLTERGRRISTLDVCRPGRLTLLTGLGGAGWCAAVAHLAADGVPIDAVVIGPLAPYEDPYGDFARLCLPDETGALLVRPDLFVAWRVATAPDDLGQALRETLDAVLSRRAV